jgi:uncharacterized protein YqjF (DUF2071 family)
MTSLITHSSTSSSSSSSSSSPIVAKHGWRDMFFLHWAWPAARLAPLLPPGLVLDRFDGDAFLTVAPLRIESMRPRGFPSFVGLSFDEITVRTYVKGLGGRGMYFLDVESGSALASLIGRRVLGLPYEHAKVKHRVSGREISYQSRRADSARKAMAVRATRTTEISHVPCSPLERFLLDRRSVFVDRGGTGKGHHLVEVVLQHPPLRVRAGTAVVEDTSLLLAEHLGAAPAVRPIVHCAEPVDVGVCAPQIVGASVTHLRDFKVHNRLIANA